MPVSRWGNNGVARYFAGTVLLSTLIAVALTAFSEHHRQFSENFVYSQCIGLLTYSVIDGLRRLVWRKGVRSQVVLFGLALVAAPIGWYGGSSIANLMLGRPLGSGGLGPNAVLGFLTLTAGCGLAGTYLFWSREQLASSERAAAEARLRLLQAQIEPHFLFNTLANLQALIAVDPQRAQAMLGHLDAYLRATLATTRNDSGTLAQEFELLRVYLEILAIRMGPRLVWTLELPDALGGARLPPMLLQPLVENAIRHGLEPKLDGGMVRVEAREESGRLVLTVEDSGLGPDAEATPGTGVGLANVRQRMDAVYPGEASLQIGERADRDNRGGTRVVLRLPLSR